MYTRVTFGFHDCPSFVCEPAFALIKEFVCLPPTDWALQDVSIEYQVPHHQCFNLSSGYMFISSDIYLQSSTAWIETQLARPEYFSLVNPERNLRFNMLTVEKLEREERNILLKENAAYSDVYVVSRHRIATCIGWEKEWTFEFKELYCCPFYEGEISKSALYFKNPPRYQITAITPHNVTTSEVLAVMELSIPSVFKSQSGLTFKMM